MTDHVIYRRRRRRIKALLERHRINLEPERQKRSFLRHRRANRLQREIFAKAFAEQDQNDTGEVNDDTG